MASGEPDDECWVDAQLPRALERETETEWFNETTAYLADRYHELSPAEIAELRAMGERFVQPPKASQPETADAASAA